jgi:hypoxanthine phosphoribosyltransferase
LIKASEFHPDIVIAIGRGGYVPARLLCDYLGIMALTSIKIEHYLRGAEKQKSAVIRYPLHTDIMSQRVLLVDDVNDSGDTLELALQHLKSFQPAEIRTAVMHDKKSTGFSVDYRGSKIVKWRWLIYPWAVCEDITAFLKRLSPQPQTLAEAQRQLADCYGIKIAERRLETIYSFMD